MPIIINNKNISTEKKLFLQQGVFVFLIFASFFTSVCSTKAEKNGNSEISFLVEKISEEKKTNQNSSNEGSGASTESFASIIGENKKIPVAISNPAEMEKAVEFASEKTGVRKDFIMGMLVVESNLGRNPGKCTYQEVEEGALKSHKDGYLSRQAWETFQERRETIKVIADNLDYDYEKLNVSCNPGSAYAGTGGAMGIAQFMPDTWLEYKDRISEIVGKKNPDPWDKTDAAVAMALKLSDVYGVTEHNRYAERNAAKMYLSGTTSGKYDWYANQIFYWSQNYRELIG